MLLSRNPEAVGTHDKWKDVQRTDSAGALEPGEIPVPGRKAPQVPIMKQPIGPPSVENGTFLSAHTYDSWEDEAEFQDCKEY